MKNLILKGGRISNNDIVEGEIKENISEKSVWHEVFINERKVYVEVDTNKDNYVDSAYYGVQDSQKARWFHLKPVAKYNLIPLDYILDIMNMGDLKGAFIEAGTDRNYGCYLQRRNKGTKRAAPAMGTD